MLDSWSLCSAGFNSRFSAFINSRRVQIGASTGRFRHARTIDDASAFSKALCPVGLSVRIGQVAVMEKPDLIMAESIASQPFDEVLSFASVLYFVCIVI